MSGNVVATETWRGLQGMSSAQQAYLYCLGFQSLAAIVWWPGTGLLAAERTPATLLAVLLAVGLSLSYQSVRMGAEELMLAGQQSIREWLVSTRVPLSQLMAGYVIAHIIQTLHWILLSSPIVLIAWSVGGTDWRVLTASLAISFLMAGVFRIAGAIVYLLFGQYRDVTWYCLRMILIAVFAAGAFVSPATSYWHVTKEMLALSHAGIEQNLLTDFLLIYGVCLVTLYGIFCFLALRIRSFGHRIES